MNATSISDRPSNIGSAIGQSNGSPQNISPLHVETFQTFSINQLQRFDIILANHQRPTDLRVSISNPILGSIDRQLDWSQQQAGNSNKCRVSFRAPMVGLYLIKVEIQNQPQYSTQFQAKAYDLSKVFINDSSGKCFVNQSYEFSVDASEAGEGQLEIAVNEGEIPNQVQVLDNGKCIVNFIPEDCVPHIVDIKFNGHNVNGCPFVVDVTSAPGEDMKPNQQIQKFSPLSDKPVLIKEERILVNSVASFQIDNVILDRFNKGDLVIIDPENQIVKYKLIEEPKQGRYKFEFTPSVVGDYTVELGVNSQFFSKLPSHIVEQFPFPLKVFDFNKVIVSDVVDGVIGHPIYFFIDASQAGSGNLEIRVSSKTRNVPNSPHSEANAKIRVNFTPTELVDHSIDVKFNGIPVPGNPFLVKVAQYPQARLPTMSEDMLKYVAIDESISFLVDYIGTRERKNMNPDELTEDSCQVYVLRPDSIYTKLTNIKLISTEKQTSFRISFKPTKIGPYKLFITVNNELLPKSPILSNVYNINEVKVLFEGDKVGLINPAKATGYLNKPVTFTVDASRAGEGTLALAVMSGISKSPVQTDVKVSDKGHGLYNLTFVPTEFAPHSIDMSFNDRVVPESPFVIDILDSSGKSSQAAPSVNKTNGNNNLKTETSELSSEISIKEENRGMDSGAKAYQNQQGTLKKTQTSKYAINPPTSSAIAAGSKAKSIAFGLINSSNTIYLEPGVLEANRNQVNFIGPNNEKVPFVVAKVSSQSGESKRPFIEYKPKSIGTHTISVLEGGKDLLQYYVEICDPNLIKITDFNPKDTFVAGKTVTLGIDSSKAGQVKLDSVTIFGPKRANGKVRDGDQTILGRIKSISSSSSSSSLSVPVEYSMKRVSDHKQELSFIPSIPGKYSIDVRCLGQSIGGDHLPLELEVKSVDQLQQEVANQSYSSQIPSKKKSTIGQGTPLSTGTTVSTMAREKELLQSIVVHGVSLRCSPVNSTGAFIIETNRLAQARDFDVLITDPSNNLVDVQCYLQPDGNLLAEWTPRRVGAHKIEVLYMDQPVPGSPFITEAFDPSGVIIENIKNTIFNVNDKIEFKLDRKEAGQGELNVSITSPEGSDLHIDVEPVDDGEPKEIISFKPTVVGKYKITITFGGYEIPKSPITFTVRDDKEPVKVFGTGLRCAEIDRSAQFSVEGPADGELKLRIECGDREIVPKIEKRGNIHTIKYKPTEIGYSTISLYWNGAHLEGSPFSVPTNDLSKILFLSGTNKSSNSNNQRLIDYEPRVTKEITLDTSKCGPGDLKAEAYCRANPAIKYTIPVIALSSSGRYKLEFTCPPKEDQLTSELSLKDLPIDTTYVIRFYYNNLFVPEQLASVVATSLRSSLDSGTPNQASQPRDRAFSSHSSGILSDLSNKAESQSENNNNTNNHKRMDSKIRTPIDNQQVRTISTSDEPIVALRGHGLADARCGEEAEFTIDGSEAGPGKPTVRFSGANDDIVVRLGLIGEKRYRATYVPSIAGVYSLNVLWDGKQVAGCPITVNVTGSCDASKVICTGDGLKGGILGEEIKVFVDTRRAGPGELTALCTGPQKVAFCELLDRGDGTFILYIKPQEPGRQFLTIKYGGQHIPKSPFLIKVSGKPDPYKVRVYGPGVEHGVLSLYQSRFVCDTRGAGAGQLTVRIRGPKGAFRMETQRESQRDRTILCKYDPTEPGDYTIEIKWSGRHVPGSPFSVMIFDTQEELNRFVHCFSNRAQ